MKTLKDQIAEFQEHMTSQVSPDILQTMQDATFSLQNLKLEQKSIKTGDQAPKFSLPNHKGEKRSLPSYLSESTIVLSFYRGGWCPYCNLELRALQNSLQEIEQLGAKLVAISPEMPDHSLTTIQKNDLAFDILYDKGNETAESYGLTMQLPNALLPIYEQFGIDIPKHNGDDSYILPMPATYVINKQGEIIHHFVDIDYTNRLEPDQIIQVLANNVHT